MARDERKRYQEKGCSRMNSLLYHLELSSRFFVFARRLFAFAQELHELESSRRKALLEHRPSSNHL